MSAVLKLSTPDALCRQYLVFELVRRLFDAPPEGIIELRTKGILFDRPIPRYKLSKWSYESWVIVLRDFFDLPDERKITAQLVARNHTKFASSWSSWDPSGADESEILIRVPASAQSLAEVTVEEIWREGGFHYSEVRKKVLAREKIPAIKE